MASSCVLRLSRKAMLKTIEPKAWGLREFSSTVFLSTKSEDSKKTKQEKSKKQQPPPDVVAPKERVKLLPSPRAEFPKKLSSSNSYPAAVNRSKTIVSFNSDDIKKQTDGEIRRLLPGKTVVEFPQQVSVSSLREKDTYLATYQQIQKPAEVDISSSDSDSDGEDGALEIVLKPHIAISTKREFSQKEALETGPQRTLKLTGKTEFRKAQVESTHVKKFYQPAMKLMEQPEAYKDSKVPKSEVIKSFREQSTKETQMQNSIFKLNELNKENQKLVEICSKLSDQMEEGSSTQLEAGTKLSIVKEENIKGKLKAVDFTADYFENKDILEEQVSILNLEAPFPQTKEDILEENVPTGANEEVIQGLAKKLENQGIIQEPESAEPFDNSTYKNLQHHNYNTYTFLDFNMDLSKFRLPQPSSGRESPRH